MHARCPGWVKMRSPGGQPGSRLCPQQRTSSEAIGMSQKCHEPTSSIVLLALRIVRCIDKNRAGWALELQLHDSFFVQGPYEMRLTRRHDGECADPSDFRI